MLQAAGARVPVADPERERARLKELEVGDLVTVGISDLGPLQGVVTNDPGNEDAVELSAPDGRIRRWNGVLSTAAITPGAMCSVTLPIGEEGDTYHVLHVTPAEKAIEAAQRFLRAGIGDRKQMVLRNPDTRTTQTVQVVSALRDNVVVREEDTGRLMCVSPMVLEDPNEAMLAAERALAERRSSREGKKPGGSRRGPRRKSDKNEE